MPGQSRDHGFVRSDNLVAELVLAFLVSVGAAPVLAISRGHDSPLPGATTSAKLFYLSAAFD
jgi:hypothetical protein